MVVGPIPSPSPLAHQPLHPRFGRLRANQGDQNYELPPEADIDRLATVVIWCDRFNSAFGAADLVSA